MKCDISALAAGEQNILKLVALRLLCASASAYQYGVVKVTLECENTAFTATGRTVLESGWKALDGKIGEAEKSDEKSLPDLERAPSNGMRAAIIGSGPAGLTIAVILARYGYDQQLQKMLHLENLIK